MKRIRTNKIKRMLAVFLMSVGMSGAEESAPMRILNFQADNGFVHDSKQAALSMVEALGKKNGWEVVTTLDAVSLTKLDLKSFNVVISVDEDAFDHLLTGSGHTWISVISFDKQAKGKKDVNSFFGNLKNGSNYEGIWGCLDDDGRVWMGSRGWPVTKKGKEPLWSKKNPKVFSEKPLTVNQYYLVMGRMGAGQGSVDLDLFVNSATATDTPKVPVNAKANASLMAIDQERDATNHPGFESFIGEIARFMIFERPLSDGELAEMSRYLMEHYQIGK